jgi:hypothetical protein
MNGRIVWDILGQGFPLTAASQPKEESTEFGALVDPWAVWSS